MMKKRYRIFVYVNLQVYPKIFSICSAASSLAVLSSTIYLCVVLMCKCPTARLTNSILWVLSYNIVQKAALSLCGLIEYPKPSREYSLTMAATLFTQILFFWQDIKKRQVRYPTTSHFKRILLQETNLNKLFYFIYLITFYMSF